MQKTENFSENFSVLKFLKKLQKSDKNLAKKRPEI
jgi:hypothetical protein